MKREYMFKSIEEELAKSKVMIDAENNLNLHDMNIFLEDIIANIMNILYEVSLANTNLEISNYPSIDLKDENNKIAIQVTTNVKREKIQKTLDTFFEKKYDKQFDKLLFIVFDNHNYTAKPFELKNNFKFESEDDILTYNKLISKIRYATDDKLEKIYNYVTTCLKQNLYNIEWCIKNSERALNNLGKRYNKKLNVYSVEERKVKMFFHNDNCKEEIIELLEKLMIHIENNDLKLNIDIKELYNNFNKANINKYIEIFDESREKIIKKYEKSPSDYDKIYSFDKTYNETINDIKKLVDEFFSKIIIYKGVAGIGKSHTLANFVNEYYIKQKVPALLVLGQDFSNSSNIEYQLLNITGGTNDFNEMLNRINQLGIIKNINIPIIIDGINESNDKTIWKKGLNDFIKQVLKFSNIKLLLSIRDTYYESCIPEEIRDDDSILKTSHSGFSTNRLDAIKQFFDSYDIKMPLFQIINNEFSNPLFLINYCEIISKFHIDINEYDYRNFNDIFEMYLDRVNSLFLEKFEIDTTRNIIKDILSEYVKKWLITNKYFSYEEFLEILKPISELYSLNKVKMLNFIIENGLFYKEIHLHNEVIIFTYERYEKISIANYLLINITNVEELKFELNDGILHPYIDVSEKFDNGILEELINIIQYKYNVDFIQLINFEHIKFDYYIKKNYIKSLVWFTGKYEATIILNNIKKLYKENDYENDIIDTFIKMSYLENNPLNVNVLDNYLKKLDMPQLDFYWTIIIDNYYTNYSKASIDSIINYCLEYGNLYLNVNNGILISRLLSWLLSSTNRYLRDRATKALVKIFLNHNDIALETLTHFNNVNDLYILERIIAAIYGSVVRSKNNEEIDKLSEKLYNVIYRGKETIDNILIKVYSLKYFSFVKKNYFILLYDKIKEEKKSKWYESLPSNQEIDKYRYSNEECAKDKRKYANSTIIDSMVTEYGRGVGGYGDFGRYTLEHLLEPFEYLFNDVQLLANIATKRVFEYGYDYKLFGDYDSAVKYFQTRHDHCVERVGKKYQWIATYELLSKLYDNYTPHYYFYSDDIVDFDEREYYDENHLRTYDQDKIEYVRYRLDEEFNSLFNIDVTNFILKQSVEKKYLNELDFKYDKEEQYDKYIFKEINGKKYLDLFNFYSSEDRKYNLTNVDRNATTIVCTAVIYSDIKKLKSSSFKEYSQGTYNEQFNMQLYDIPFSFEYEINYNRKFQNQDILKSFRTCYDEYVWEGNYDESVNGCIKIVLPQKWIVNEFNIRQAEEGKWYKDNQLVCFNLNENDSNQELLIDYDVFIDFLSKNNFKIAWTIYCEKSHNNSHKSWRTNLYYDFKNKKFSKEVYKIEPRESKSLF